jgi:hypothetical protein
MTDILIRIKRAVIRGNYVFSVKAKIEMEHDHISVYDVVESITNAVAIYKKIRSNKPFKKARREMLYIIQSPNLSGLPIYTKGKFVKIKGRDIFYFLISSKIVSK